ncbi:MAG: HlyD family efflux transporter periplasmic adaptor subunit [Alphaproteobacteria bacterium]|jgi:HlyD family secretion protein|nr:HlyD family efflux transporter periplasmic adaptor subunit [Alphaproteobacteria bacterium]
MKRLVLLLCLFLAACGEKKNDAWLGYAEGDTAFISAPQPGWLTSLKVQRGQAVHRGDLLFLLDDAREQAGRDQAAAALGEAKASLAQEQSNLSYARTELNRQNGLARVGAGTPAQRDLALNSFRQSGARIAQLKAQIAQMEASLSNAAYGLSQRAVTAQAEGPVQDIYFREGEYVPAATPVLSILPPANVFVRFFVPESQLSKVRLGQAVQITCDNCKPLTARISFIAAREEFTPPVIFSVENREKLVFKLEARAPGGLALNPGQPVEVRPQ